MAKILVDEAPAGRVLDAAAAEALGLEVFRSKEDYFSKGAPYAATFDVHVRYPAFYHEEHRNACCVENYSTDIAAADILWNELDKLVEAGHSVCVHSFQDYETHSRLVHGVFLDVLPRGPGKLLAKAETRPHAITRAFLKAKSVTHVEVPDG